MSSAYKAALIFALPALALTSACSSDPVRRDPLHRLPEPGASVVRHGTVTAIEVVAPGSRSHGVGPLLGAVVGAPAPSQAGHGIGRGGATVPGAAGATAVGNPVELRSKDDSEVYRVSVRLDDGRIGQFDYRHIDDLRVGHRVRVVDGRLHRV